MAQYECDRTPFFEGLEHTYRLFILIYLQGFQLNKFYIGFGNIDHQHIHLIGAGASFAIGDF
jgi:hypothetical protein